MVILDQLINDGELSLLDQAIISYVYFVNHNNDAPKTAGERVCHATNDWLAIKFSCSKRTIINAIKRLEEKEWIKLFRQVETIGCMQIEKRYMWVNEEKLSALGEADIKARLEEVKMRRTTHSGGEEISLGGVKELQYTPVKNFHGVGCQNCNDIKKDPSEEYIERSEDICPSSAQTYVNSRIERADAPVKASFDASITPFENDPKDRWNSIAARFHLPKVHRFDKDRIKSLKARIKECDSENVFWRTIETALEKSKFLQGKSSDWRPGIDFFLRKSSFTKVAEGAYTTQKASLIESDNNSPIEQAVNGYKPQSQAELIDAFLNS